MALATLRRAIFALLATTLAVSLIAGATVYGLQALHLWLATSLDNPLLSLALTAAVAITIPVLAAALALRPRRPAPQPPAPANPESELVTQLAHLARSHPLLAVGLAGLTGIVRGQQARR